MPRMLQAPVSFSFQCLLFPWYTGMTLETPVLFSIIILNTSRSCRLLMMWNTLSNSGYYKQKKKPIWLLNEGQNNSSRNWREVIIQECLHILFSSCHVCYDLCLCSAISQAAASTFLHLNNTSKEFLVNSEIRKHLCLPTEPWIYLAVIATHLNMYIRLAFNLEGAMTKPVLPMPKPSSFQIRK